MIPPIESLPMMGSGMESMPTSTQPAAVGGSFGELLGASIESLGDQMNRAEKVSEMAATGELNDPTMALVEVEKADLAFQMAVQVRNRVLESWQEMTRMGF